MWLGCGGAQTLGSYGAAPGRSGTLEDVPAEHWDFLANDLLAPTTRPTRTSSSTRGYTPTCRWTTRRTTSCIGSSCLRRCVHESGKRVVCGHTSQKSGVPKTIPGAVCIDTYAHGGGWLTCLDAATGRYWQADLLGRRREGWIEEA